MMDGSIVSRGASSLKTDAYGYQASRGPGDRFGETRVDSQFKQAKVGLASRPARVLGHKITP